MGRTMRYVTTLMLVLGITALAGAAGWHALTSAQRTELIRAITTRAHRTGIVGARWARAFRNHVASAGRRARRTITAVRDHQPPPSWAGGSYLGQYRRPPGRHRVHKPTRERVDLRAER